MINKKRSFKRVKLKKINLSIKNNIMNEMKKLQFKNYKLMKI